MSSEWSNRVNNTLEHAIMAAPVSKNFGSKFSKSDGANKFQ
ncbi:hypothetical protein [Fervidobacterium pennivorans]|jgi:hypothetical protein|nr:hypothetical protein [Fervidobacterium pennivorans]